LKYNEIHDIICIRDIIFTFAGTFPGTKGDDVEMVESYEKDMQFYKLYEQLASLTSNVNAKPDIPGTEAVLNEIAAMFRLSKGITNFYRNPADEQRGIGETMISYDTGKEGRPVHTVRFVTRLLSVTTMTVYMSDDVEPLTEEELGMVDLTMRTALVFISRNRLQDMAEQLAFYDDAGYRNIRSFFRYMLWCGQPGGLDGTVAVNYNIRHFSLVNDEYGREAGDTVLKNHYSHIAERIGEDGMIARLGGDSFVFICRKELMDELLDYLTEADVVFRPDGTKVKLTASVGVFVIPEGYAVNTPNDIMGKIMYAYRIAQNGGNEQIIFYDDKLISRKNMAMKIQQIFPEALKNREFRVFYQPKVNIITGEICGAEALCRWFRDGKIVPPMEFIPILEQTSDICKLDFYMLDLVCCDIRRWLDEGRKAIRVSINLSRKHMMDHRLLDTIMTIIDRHNVPHEYIEIELTETTTDVEFRDLRRVVGGLQENNICTSVDDFGMGYSSLNLIRVIPWNVLKVDRSFLPLDSEGPNNIRSIMFKHVVSMAKELGLECIVEGVETTAQLSLLRENNCELAQGYLFDCPLPVGEFERRLDMERYEI